MGRFRVTWGIDLHELWPRAGRGVFMLAALSAAALAYGDVMQEALKRCGTGQVGPALRKRVWRGAVAAVCLALAQVIYLATTYYVPGFSSAAGVGWFYLFCTAPVAFLWAAGRCNEARLGWPLEQTRWTDMKKMVVGAAIGIGGVGLSVLLFALVQMQAGTAVRELADETAAPAMALLAFWLIINAPWIEELTFRHYIIPRLALWWGGGRWAIAASIVVSAAVFAAGHAGHTVPAWPKLVQVLLWGVALGWARVWLGTAYAIALHLMWNLSAPLVALVVSVQG